MEVADSVVSLLPVRILFCSYVYAPSVGGIESVSRILAAEFVQAGHEVIVVTDTEGETLRAYGLSVIRRPNRFRLLKLTRWAEIVFHNNISLRYAWPLVLIRRPWVVAHHTWLRGSAGEKGLAERMKEFLIRKAVNISISPAIAAALPVASRIIPDPYEADVFHVRNQIPRNRDLVFVGRLVSDKGVDVLLRALDHLGDRGIYPTLTIVGDGPERAKLEMLAGRSKQGSQIQFHGQRTGEELSVILNQHRVLVVPSRWNEPFGVVALEGIACGCVVIGTQGGGLPGAIGPCGVTVPNDDAKALAEVIGRTLSDPSLQARYFGKAEQHLKQHHPSTIAEKYLTLFREASALS